MKTNDRTRDEKTQYDFNGEAAKISAMSSGKKDKYGYYTGEDIPPSYHRYMIRRYKYKYK